MFWRIEIAHKPGVFDADGQSVAKAIQDLGINSIQEVEVERVYNLHGSLTEEQAKTVAQKLLTDPVTQRYHLHLSHQFKTPKETATRHVIEIAYNTGVMDPVEASTLKGIRDLGFKEIEAVTTAKKYILAGELSKVKRDLIVGKVLANKLIQHEVKYARLADMVPGRTQTSFSLVVIDLLDAKDKELMAISQKGQLFLNLEEMKTIQKHFQKQGRDPTDCELETIAQTWSEHCFHKTFRGNIEYTYQENGTVKKKRIRNLLKSTIAKATLQLKKPWCVSVFHDNAGVIAFDKDDHVCFKAETHNHPSALEPFGGANTGVGGVIRDILGTGLGAKPICNTDVFCFAPPTTDNKDLPDGTLHPKRVMKGVVSGVRDYGNKMGIPTINGAILFDKHYVGNPLVYCGCIGLMPKDKVEKKVSPGDLIVAVGGRTGRDGIHGATFSSGELTTESEEVSSGAVQIGNPIEEKKVLDGQLKARDENLYSAVTDCGAGGFSSAVGEMGAQTGARVDLEKVPLKYQGLRYMEIWISESQERMVFAVPPKHVKRFLEIFEEENVDATVIGEFTDNRRLQLFFYDAQVCDLDMNFLHDGNPRVTKKAVWKRKKTAQTRVAVPKNLNHSLRNALAHFNVCSKEWVIRQYDHEVQGKSIIKPLVGVQADGPSDASVLKPKFESNKGIAVSNGINPNYGKIDPFWMAASCIDEAIRGIVAVGGDPSRIAILDNFCWGNPDKPDRLGGLVRCAEGCYKAAVGYEVPFISGKDSLYNEYTQGKKSIAIPGTILISAIGILEDVRKAVTMDFKEAGNLIYIVGETKEELGGSIYLDTQGQLGHNVPQVAFKTGKKIFTQLFRAIGHGLVRAAHDCSDGGLGVCAAEMAFAGGLGAHLRLKDVPYKGTLRDDYILFSESNSRFVVEVERKNKKSFEAAFKGLPKACIGVVTDPSAFIVDGLKTKEVIHQSIEHLKAVWQAPLAW